MQNHFSDFFLGGGELSICFCVVFCFFSFVAGACVQPWAIENGLGLAWLETSCRGVGVDGAPRPSENACELWCNGYKLKGSCGGRVLVLLLLLLLVAKDEDEEENEEEETDDMRMQIQMQEQQSQQKQQMRQSSISRSTKGNGSRKGRSSSKKTGPDTNKHDIFI